MWQVHKAIPEAPLVGMGGIMTGIDAVEFLLAGATAVAVGTATFVNPAATTDVVAELEAFMKEQGISDVGELIGGVQPPLA